MGIFSKTTEYALRAVFYIASVSNVGKKVGIAEIAKHTGSPEPFLGKILQTLTKNGLILSTRGPSGGFYITEKEMEYTLADIIGALDGPSIFVGCGLGLKECSHTDPCPLHEEFKKIREDLSALLHKTKIAQFNQALLAGKLKLFP